MYKTRALSSIVCAWGIVMSQYTSELRAQGLEPTLFHNLSKAIVRVHAFGCPSVTGSADATRTLNGFFFGTERAIVTSRHGIAGCSTIKYCATSGPSACQMNSALAAVLDKTVARSDLALLRVTQLPKASADVAVIRGAKAASVNEDVFVLAHWLDAPSVTDKKIRIGNGSSTIATKLADNDRALQELRVLQSPSLTLRVLNLDGGIIDGVSGAPLVSSSGELVGIIDGGLPNGVAGINWAIPASELKALLSSSEPPPSVIEGKKTSIHHAQEFATASLNMGTHKIPCGSHDYVLVRSLSLRDIAATTDDRFGLTQLVIATGIGVKNPVFDVYADTESPAVFVVPGGATLGGSGRLCEAVVRQSATGSIALRFDSRAIRDANDAQVEAMAFEALVGGSSTAVPDLQWSYPWVYNRYDGAAFQRKTINLFSPWASLQGHLFETLAAKGRSFAASAATYTSSSVDLGLIQFACTPQLVDCQSIAEDAVAWKIAVLAVHLTTYPVN